MNFTIANVSHNEAEAANHCAIPHPNTREHDRTNADYRMRPHCYAADLHLLELTGHCRPRHKSIHVVITPRVDRCVGRHPSEVRNDYWGA